MKIIKLTINEILKQVKKVSFKISLIILMLVSIFVPLLSKVFENNSNYLMFSKEDVNYYSDSLINNPKSEQEIVENELLKIKIDVINKAIEDKVSINSSFMGELLTTYRENMQEQVLIDCILKDEKLDYDKIREEFDLYDSYNYTYMSKSLLVKEKEKLKEEENILKKAIEDKDYEWYINRQIKNFEENIARGEEIDKNKKILEVYKLLKNKNVHDEYDFRVSEANNLIGYYREDYRIMTLKEYENSGYTMKYDDYVKLAKERQIKQEEKEKKSLYAIENNINYNKGGTKTILNTTISSNVAIISVIVAVVAGGIVANEFQRGTIRLLVIRSAKRWKILLSKFLCVVVIALGLLLTSSLVSFIVSGIAYGFSDYAIPALIVRDGSIIKSSFVLLQIKDLFILLIPILFVGLGAFTLSVITNSTALSVGFSIFLLVGGELGMGLLSLIKFPYTAYTFLPYLNYSQFIGELEYLEKCLYMQTYYTFNMANIVLLVWSVLFYTVSNIIFIKKDIKN